MYWARLWWKKKGQILKILLKLLKDEIPMHLIFLVLANVSPCLLASAKMLKKIKDSQELSGIVINAVESYLEYEQV